MADTSQPTVLDYATPTQFRITFNRIPTVTWFCTEANIPGISLGEAQFPTPMADMVLSGDKLTFETMTMGFIVRTGYYFIQCSSRCRSKTKSNSK